MREEGCCIPLVYPPKWLRKPGQGQANTRSQKFHPDLPNRRLGAKHLGHHLPDFPRHITKELNGKQCSWYSNSHSDMEYGCPGSMPNRHTASQHPLRNRLHSKLWHKLHVATTAVTHTHTHTEGRKSGVQAQAALTLAFT